MTSQTMLNNLEENENQAFQVRFRKVGQGDTVIIEHQNDEGRRRLGIIDCKNDQQGNAVIAYLNHLSRQNIDFEIAFFIISHPHNDHFSGAAELLKYIIRSKTPLEKVASNLNIHNDYPKSEYSHENTVRNIRAQLQALHKHGDYAKFRETIIGLDSKFKLTPDIEVSCFAPTAVEIGRYVDSSRDSYDKQTRPPSHAANWLSTVLTIVYKDKYILLTSDAEKSIFSRLATDINDQLTNKKLYGAQIPHHGSARNFDEEFWKQIDKSPGAKAVLSVGPDDPKHPAKNVIDLLQKFLFDVLRTDQPKKVSKNQSHSEALMVEISEPVDAGADDILLGMPL